MQTFEDRCQQRTAVGDCDVLDRTGLHHHHDLLADVVAAGLLSLQRKQQIAELFGVPLTGQRTTDSTDQTGQGLLVTDLVRCRTAFQGSDQAGGLDDLIERQDIQTHASLGMMIEQAIEGHVLVAVVCRTFIPTEGQPRTGAEREGRNGAVQLVTDADQLAAKLDFDAIFSGNLSSVLGHAGRTTARYFHLAAGHLEVAMDLDRLRFSFRMLEICPSRLGRARPVGGLEVAGVDHDRIEQVQGAEAKQAVDDVLQGAACEGVVFTLDHCAGKCGRSAGRHDQLRFRMRLGSCSQQLVNGDTACPATGVLDRGQVDEDARNGSGELRTFQQCLVDVLVVGNDQEMEMGIGKFMQVVLLRCRAALYFGHGFLSLICCGWHKETGLLSQPGRSLQTPHERLLAGGLT